MLYCDSMKKHVFQLFRFAVVGSGNTLLDLGIYAGLTRTILFFEIYYPLAAVIAFVIASLNSFLWNKHWTFQDRFAFHHTQMIKFYVIAAMVLVLNTGFLTIFVEFFHMNDLWAKLLAAIIAGVWNFLMQKFFVFQKKEKE